MGNKSFLSLLFSGRNSKRLFGSVPKITYSKNNNSVSTSTTTTTTDYYCIETDIIKLCYDCNSSSCNISIYPK